MPRAKEAVQTLVKFSRFVADASDPREVLAHLVEEATERLQADGAVAFEITDQGTLAARVGRNVPEKCLSIELEDVYGGEASEEVLLAHCTGLFDDVRLVPVAAAGRLFGALVMLYREGHAPDADGLAVAEGLCDLAGTSLDRRLKETHLHESDLARREAEAALARTERLRTLGQMAAGIAHDVKNLLNPLKLNIQLARRRGLGDDPRAGDLLDRIEATVGRGVDVVERLRAFSRQAPEAVAEQIDVNRLVGEAVELAKSRTHRCQVTVELGAPAAVRGSSSEFVSAVLNLIVNAADAMPDGGRITVRTGLDGSRAAVVVGDDGPGMPPEVEARLFEPFFTTKGDAGTGLGLATLYAFVQRSNGSITVDTAVGRGTRFTLSFPAAPAQREPEQKSG